MLTHAGPRRECISASDIGKGMSGECDREQIMPGSGRGSQPKKR